MGIPKMFRFLTDRYPLIMQRLDEDHVFDHFYLDMNGIIHQCTHPNDDKIAIQDIDNMFDQIFNYTERLFRIVAPTTLMFLAVDGVAPRAKMNQQRSRRFRSAKDAERAMAEAIARGDDIPSGVPFDSNCITPGTKFMYDLSQRFRRWIHEKMSSDPAWQQGCTVVFSGSEVPGEGEHKIMDYIRSWRSSDEYSPQIRHCMYGLDADLMMLGLVAHAPHFTLIREKMRFTKGGRKVPQMRGTTSDANEFQLLEIAMLRDMLFLEFKRGDSNDPLLRSNRRRSPSRQDQQTIKAMSDTNADATSSERATQPMKNPSFKVNAARIVDDFVFMCMLVGNDFIPNIPHLDIAEGAINLMFRIYKEMLFDWGGYLTDRHRLHPDRLESFFERISQTEMMYFEQRGTAENIPEYKSSEFRSEYYRQKFQFDVEGEEGPRQLHRLRQIYMEGLHWVLQYYHNGVSSWNWFYPDFYALLASDLVNLRSLKIGFQKGKPFRPLTQLMAVLPPESAGFLPEPMRALMTDSDSPVVDFYPTEFITDPNGKRNAWEAVVVVPFIEEKRLLKEVNAIDRERELTEEERKRDETGPEYWFYAKDYPSASERTAPVRPSKFYIPQSRNSRSPSPRGQGSYNRGSQSRSRNPSPYRRSPSVDPRERPSFSSNPTRADTGRRAGSDSDWNRGKPGNSGNRGRGRGRARGPSRGGSTRVVGSQTETNRSTEHNRGETTRGRANRGGSARGRGRQVPKETTGDVGSE